MKSDWDMLLAENERLKLQMEEMVREFAKQKTAVYERARIRSRVKQLPLIPRAISSVGEGSGAIDRDAVLRIIEEEE